MVHGRCYALVRLIVATMVISSGGSWSWLWCAAMEHGCCATDQAAMAHGRGAALLRWRIAIVRQISDDVWSWRRLAAVANWRGGDSQRWRMGPRWVLKSQELPTTPRLGG